MKVEWNKDKSLAGLYKRVSRNQPIWAVKARQRGTGRVVTVTLGRCDLLSVNEARRDAKAALLALSKGIHPNDETRKTKAIKDTETTLEKARELSLGDALGKFLGYRNYKPNTIKDITQSTSRNFGDWVNRPLRSISREDVLERFQQIKKRVRERREGVNQRNASLGFPLSRFTDSDGSGEAQRAFRYLTAIFNSFKNDTVGDLPLLSSNPCDVLKDKKVRTVLKPRANYLAEDDIEMLVATLNSVAHKQYKGPITKNDADFMTMLLFTGLRLNEARTMRWADVSFKTRMFSVRNTKNHSTHTLPMTPSIERTLKRLFKRRALDAMYVFSSAINPSQPASMSRTFERICKEAGVNFTPHDLRRTFATIASEMGVDVHRIGAALNHSKQGVTAGYIQTTVLMLRETLEAIETAILKPYETDANTDT